MNIKSILSVLAVGVLGASMSMAYAADPRAEKEATPTLKERLTKDTITGTLMSIKGEYYSIKDEEGNRT